MSFKAAKSGKILEKKVFDKLYSYCGNNLNIVEQYKYKDIFNANARIDFLFINENNQKYFIECKNQKVPGSVDTKFPYYLFNMQQNLYQDSKFIFILNTDGIRKTVLNWLISQSGSYKFYIVSSKKLNELDDIFNGKAQKYVFI